MKRVFSKCHLGGFAMAWLLMASADAASTASPRERLLMDFGWKFHLGNEWGIGENLAKAGSGMGPASASFTDTSWRTLDLPHDWAVELPFDQRADASHGFKALGPGFPQNSVAWYRRTFELPRADAGKRLWIEFDGVFRDSTVFLNGWFVGRQESGYSSFRYDVTDLANCGGRNVLAVMVDASQEEGWFYEGAGIYRHVWLVKTEPLAIAPDGVFVYSQFRDNVPEGAAKVHVQTRLRNDGTNNADLSVRWEILAPDGAVVASSRKSTTIGPRSQYEERVEQTMDVSRPVLWSPESPRLYQLVTTLESGGTLVDREQTEFGIRTVAFDPEKGFLLNGKPYELNGTCNHQDHAGVGVALPDRLQYFRVARLKEMGANAYRTSHNPPTPELLQACDRLGMLVMDENRLLGSDIIHMNRLERLIRRDRNHPSVVIWSIANEEFDVQQTPAGRRVAESMQDLIRQLDPTRPVTYAAPVGNEFAGVNQIIGVRGWNYHVGPDMEAYHQAHPQQPNVGTEQASTVGTRGIYASDPLRGYVSAYDDAASGGVHSAEGWWSYFATRPWLSGGFVWTGFDYRGEPTPYGWPCISSQFGILDTCGFPKDNYWYYRSWWTREPVLHLMPHWNWPGREGEEIDVRALSNCQEVELLLNGRSLGRQTMKPNSLLKWKVRYIPGTLSAVGFRDGKRVAETRVETTGEPAVVRLEPDRNVITAGGQDVSVITVSARDVHGRIVPTASNLVLFNLKGPGRILGVGNGDPSCHEPDQYLAPWPIRRVPLNDWRWEKIADARRPDLAETAEHFDDADWHSHDAQSGVGPLRDHEAGVFRAHFEVTDREMAAKSVELCFGMIDDDGWVYVNGRKAGESHDWRTAPVFDVKRFLHPGENTVAVVVANREGAGGVNKGVALQLVEQAAPPQWKRSLFNGLAQVIVQSSREEGPLQLTASAAGLEPAEVVVQSRPGPLPAALP
jgi:beta-galactosidase